MRSFLVACLAAILIASGAAIVLMLVTFVCYLVRWIVCRIACSLTPKQETATQG